MRLRIGVDVVVMARRTFEVVLSESAPLVMRYHKGVEPDFVVENPPELLARGADSQLQKALERGTSL